MKYPVATAAGPREAYAYSGGKPFEPRLPTVVFLHGALNDHSVWTLNARWFAHHGHSVLAPDLPGHGRSGGVPLATVEALADWLIALLDAAGVERAALVGHSMGSLIALEAAGRAPARVSQLVMVGTAYPMKVSAALLDTARTDVLKAIDGVNAFSHSSLAAKPSYPGPGTWLHGASLALARRMQDGQRETNLFLNDFEVCDRYAGGLAAAARVTCPTTLVLGARDQMTLARDAVEIGIALRARTVTLACGHALQLEAPEALLAALRTALAPTVAGSAAL
jgi:pimeloyl-ACP methyl ester carboxylesterase